MVMRRSAGHVVARLVAEVRGVAEVLGVASVRGVAEVFRVAWVLGVACVLGIGGPLWSPPPWLAPIRSSLAGDCRDRRAPLWFRRDDAKEFYQRERPVAPGRDEVVGGTRSGAKASDPNMSSAAAATAKAPALRIEPALPPPRRDAPWLR